MLDTFSQQAGCKRLLNLFPSLLMLVSVLLYHHVTIFYIMIYYCVMLSEAVFNLKCWTHPHMMQHMLFCGTTVRITPVFFHTQGILSSLMSDLNTNTCLLESLRKGFGISKQHCALLRSAVPEHTNDCQPCGGPS